VTNVEVTKKRLPSWMRRDLPQASSLKTRALLERFRLNTVCDSALCPNRSECYSQLTATFMILGDVCTRSCGFCAIKTGAGSVLEDDEPERVAQAARALGLEYVVITSVARDDLEDEGAEHFAKTVRAVRNAIPGVRIEVLTPDFHARRACLEEVVWARPDVYNHNIETVRRLQRQVRPQAGYERSLTVLETVKALDPDGGTKSGLMLGLGETQDEILETMRDLRNVRCDILTLGQYLPPSQSHLPVVDFVPPEDFAALAEEAKAMGFLKVFAGPSVRSSYHAGEVSRGMPIHSSGRIESHTLSV